MDIILVLLAVLVGFIIYKTVFFLSKRISALAKIASLDKEEHISAKFTRSPILSTLFLSKMPDAAVEIGKTVYLIRFYNGVGGKTQVHFANEEYSAKYLVRQYTLFNQAFRRSQAKTPSSDTVATNVRVKIVPKLSVPEKYSGEDWKVVPVLIFNPAPNSVSYVSETKTSIKLAFTGDEFHGIKIFTGSSFYAFAERAGREYGAKLREEYEREWG